MGITGSGKSRFLANFFLQLYGKGLPATILDPHNDLGRLILGHLVRDRVYDLKTPAGGTIEGYNDILYLDIPEAERRGRFLPFNVLNQNLPPHTIASNIKEAFHRAWPALSHGAAPMFDTLVQDGVKVLLSNKLPLTSLYKLITDKRFRDSLLLNEDDHDVVAFFHDQFDRLSVHDQADQAGAALRRAHLLTFSPVLKYSLGQRDNILDFRQIIETGKSVIVNLSVPDGESRRLLGCLLTVFAEQAALSRADTRHEERLKSHHLILDEFAEFTQQSEEAFARMLSQTRKFGMYLVMAHQTYSQASERLKSAMQNVGLDVAFKLGRTDAEHAATIFGEVDPLSVKHEVADEKALDRTHPVFYPLTEQWEAWVKALVNLKTRQAYVKHSKGVTQVMTRYLPDADVDPSMLNWVEERYLAKYFTPREKIPTASASSQDGFILNRVSTG